MNQTQKPVGRPICNGCLSRPCECKAAEAYALAFGVKDWNDGFSCNMPEGV